MNFKSFFKSFYKLGIFGKGMDGIFELISGFILLSFSITSILNFIKKIFIKELIEDPKDLLANFLIHLLENLPDSVKYFWVAYLFIHGFVKVSLAIGILKRKEWIYPVSIIILSFFGFYQIYELIIGYSIFLLILTLIDFLIIYFIIFDYIDLKNKN